jgi:hypothetical protein
MEEDAYYRQTLRRETYVEVKIIPEFFLLFRNYFVFLQPQIIILSQIKTNCSKKRMNEMTMTTVRCRAGFESSSWKMAAPGHRLGVRFHIAFGLRVL